MELIATYLQRNDPDTYHFIFDDVNAQGEYLQLHLPDAPDWPYSDFAYGKYHPDGENTHLGERTTLQALGEVILTRFFTRLGY